MGGDVLQGTVELMVLKALSLEAMHGWGIGQRLDQMSGEVFQLPHGSLYPALQRMLRKGSIRSEWRTTENNRRARYYVMTPAGRRQLQDEIKSWRRASAALHHSGAVARASCHSGPMRRSDGVRCSGGNGRIGNSTKNCPFISTRTSPHVSPAASIPTWPVATP